MTTVNNGYTFERNIDWYKLFEMDPPGIIVSIGSYNRVVPSSDTKNGILYPMIIFFSYYLYNHKLHTYLNYISQITKCVLNSFDVQIYYIPDHLKNI